MATIKEIAEIVGVSSSAVSRYSIMMRESLLVMRQERRSLPQQRKSDTKRE
mgnify:CR=1 FL=1